MQKENLAKYFISTATKYLSAVEINKSRSNQHEFNGVSNIKEILGSEKLLNVPTKFLFLSDEESDARLDSGIISWYDSRKNKPSRSAEYRLYYSENMAMREANEGDLLVIALRPDKSVMVIISKSGSNSEKQLLWLFGTAETTFKINTNLASTKVSYVTRLILRELGVSVEQEIETPVLEDMIKKFGNKFPSTSVFSAFCRQTLPFEKPYNPDLTILRWLEQEEMLFRLFEKHLMQDQITSGFKDIEEFIGLAKSVLNRRKSRVGHSFENHLQQIFTDKEIRFSEQAITENKSKPDFVFPEIKFYHLIPQFKDLKEDVTILGAKYSCKDRWRQVLSEAKFVDEKYLITIESGITNSQTSEMRANKLQLIVPEEIHVTYSTDQQEWLLSLDEFIWQLRQRQSRIYAMNITLK